MTGPEGPLEPPPDRPRRFDGGSVVLGAIVGFFGTPLVVLVSVILAGAVDAAAFGVIVVTSAVFGPLVRAVVVASRQGSAQRRGFALGYAIGWACFVIALAGVCVPVLTQLG